MAVDQDFIGSHAVYEVVSFRDSAGRLRYRLFDPMTDEMTSLFLSSEEAMSLANSAPIREVNIDEITARRRARFQAEWATRQEQRQQEWIERYAAYSRYINESHEWQDRRAKVLARDNHTCQACMPGCTDRARQVHHKTYAHVGKEPLFDLVAVCDNCHRALHALEASRGITA